MGCLVRIPYFIFIGWWAAALWITLSLLLCLTIIGIPIGYKMLQFTPVIAWLEERP